jgi:hypothetical protein
VCSWRALRQRLFFFGIAMLIAEPVLHLTQRRANERDETPQLPVVRIA